MDFKTPLHSAHISNFKQNEMQFSSDCQESLFGKSLNKSTLRRGKVSLVFLSTFVQAEHIQSYSQQQQTPLKLKNMTEPIQQFIQSHQQQLIKSKKQTQRQVNNFYQSKMQEVQKDQRSITALVGAIDHQRKPNKKLMTEINQTFSRARTFTAMPIANNHGLSKRKRLQNSQKMGLVFQQFVISKSRIQTQPISSLPQNSYNQISLKADINVSQSINFTKNTKYSMRRKMKNKTENAKVKRFTFQQPENLLSIKKYKEIKSKQFRWTQIGNKRIFNLKSITDGKS